MKIQWRIDWHEGDDFGFEGKLFDSEEALSTALNKIGAQGSKTGGYYKTHVTMLVNGKAIWADRLDQNNATGERGRPRDFWRWMLDFYSSPEAPVYAAFVKVDRAERATFYQALLNGDLATAAKIQGVEL